MISALLKASHSDSYQDLNMKRTNSFKLLWQAIKSSRRPMWASIQVLIVLTVILATVFYFAERNVQPEEYNYWRSLLWAFTRYIGDPGKFAGPGPVTFTGRLVASLIGIVGIMIFAVPAGLIGSGFRSAIDKELRKKHLLSVGGRLQKAFTRKQDPKTMYRYVPRYISLGTLQAKKNMTERDVIDAVEYNPPYRLRNLATAETMGTHAQDQLVIEMFPFNRPAYGAMIDRGSRVTIACPSSAAEAGIGNFAYHLALIGGFNFISKEIEADVDEPVSFYLINKDDAPEERVEYMEDLRKLSDGKGYWTIFLISSERNYEATFHFVTKANSKTGRDSTVIERQQYVELFSKLESVLKEKYGLLSESDENYRPAGPNNVAIKIGGGETTNAFTIRIASTFVVWDPRYIQVCNTMAEVINSTIGDPQKATPIEHLKEHGTGFII